MKIEHFRFASLIQISFGRWDISISYRLNRRRSFISRFQLYRDQIRLFPPQGPSLKGARVATNKPKRLIPANDNRFDPVVSFSCYLDDEHKREI